MYIAPGTIFKDLLAVLALVFLLSILVKRLEKYVFLHKESIAHELDTSFFETIQIMQRHAGIAFQAVQSHAVGIEDLTLKRKMKTINQQLGEIEKKYTHNPAALALLGPIGTASIVLKEKRLNEKLLTIAYAIHDIFAALLSKQELTYDAKKALNLDAIMQLNSVYAKEVKQIL